MRQLLCTEVKLKMIVNNHHWLLS